jgi:hypothetical protein
MFLRSFSKYESRQTRYLAYQTSSSVRANSESLALTALLGRAQRLRTRIESWRQMLPFLSTPVLELNEQDFENGAILRLQHLTLEILIFRALLRPLSNDQVSPSDKCQEPISTIYENCHVCASVATEIVSLLRAKHFASFWPHCTLHSINNELPHSSMF